MWCVTDFSTIFYIVLSIVLIWLRVSGRRCSVSSLIVRGYFLRSWCAVISFISLIVCLRCFMLSRAVFGGCLGRRSVFRGRGFCRRFF